MKRGKRPNIIMILVDQFRNDTRMHYEIFKELGERGVLFSKLITYAPYTCASLHAIFTGMYGIDNGVDGYTKSNQYDSKRCYSLAEYLHNNGYYTRGYSFSPIFFPHRGFDSVRIVTAEEEKDILESHQNELDICFNQSKPFFVFLHHGEIHHGIVKDVIRKYDDFSKEYFGNIEENRKRYLTYTDSAAQYVEKLISYIDEIDSQKNTLSIVFTDHGSGLGEKPGEKAYGIYTYDYSIWVWLYMIHSNLLPLGKEFTTQIRTIDILPTILDIVGIKQSRKHKPIKGRSMLPIVRSEESDDRLAFSETGGVDGPHPSPNRANVKCVRDRNWKLIYNTTTNKTELYDIERDPQETDNLASKNPKKAEELWMKLSEYL